MCRGDVHSRCGEFRGAKLNVPECSVRSGRGELQGAEHLSREVGSLEVDRCNVRS